METQWESICKRCGKCCYHKIIYRDILYYTDIPCKYLDPDTMKCRVYSARQQVNPECATLTPAVVASGVLPSECAYLQYCATSNGATHHIDELPARLQRRLMRELD
jgi:uncharacterized cysteine cluster protein YcgN (CxxCxxCC family)